ncbi:actin-like protein ARP8 [Panicum miliaceum]|uniref:Actin-like protein ARP8 n=1 Tax=Panicum miliaceum TaxID=4540 RepID=A0A3L6R2M0_PANMI|nr:actin-like protein ARP8 [Panicum miliaceum]
MDDSRKNLPYAPYIMYRRVTKITFPKDGKHEVLHLRSRGEDAPPLPTHHGYSSSAASHVEAPHLSAPSYVPSSSCRHGNGYIVKRVLRSIFCMCKTMVCEVNENRRDIIEMKSEMGLPCDPHHELPDSCRTRDEDEQNKEEAPSHYREYENDDDDEEEKDEDDNDDE